PAKPNERIILYSHGGAYIRFSPRSHRGITMQLSKELNVRVLSVEYRLAPENPFPSALHDLVSVYLALIDPNGKYKFEPHNIIVAGDSAGGNLTTSLFLYLRDNGLLLPAGGFLISPWLDLNSDSDSYSRNAPFDHLRFCGKGNLYHPTRLYTNPRATSWAEVQDIVNNPYVSPIKAESLDRLPPLLIQYGQCETPRDDIYNFAQRIIKEAGPDKVLHEEYEDMVHVFHSFGFLKQTKDAYA
ncbi:Alpha/beta hydrolase fold-3, partial [Ramicandelaber brevisporus]